MRTITGHCVIYRDWLTDRWYFDAIERLPAEGDRLILESGIGPFGTSTQASVAASLKWPEFDRHETKVEEIPF